MFTFYLPSFIYTHTRHKEYKDSAVREYLTRSPHLARVALAAPSCVSSVVCTSTVLFFFSEKYHSVQRVYEKKIVQFLSKLHERLNEE